MPSGCSEACAADRDLARVRAGPAVRPFEAARERGVAVRGAAVFLFLAIAMASLREGAERARAEGRM